MIFCYLYAFYLFINIYYITSVVDTIEITIIILKRYCEHNAVYVSLGYASFSLNQNEKIIIL